MTVVLGEMDVAWVKPNPTSQGETSVHNASGSHPTSLGGYQLPGDDSRFVSYPVDDVHYDQATKASGMGDELRRGKKRDQLVTLMCRPQYPDVGNCGEDAVSTRTNGAYLASPNVVEKKRNSRRCWHAKHYHDLDI